MKNSTQIHLPTNIEIIIRDGLENKILIDIPTLPLSVLGTKRKNGCFDVTLISQIGNKKIEVAKNISEIEMAVILMKTKAFKELGCYKTVRTARQLTKYYKQVINQTK